MWTPKNIEKDWFSYQNIVLDGIGAEMWHQISGVPGKHIPRKNYFG